VIREATADDVPRLVELGVEFLASEDYREAPRVLSPPDFSAHLLALIASPMAGIFVAERDGAVVGGFAAIIAPDVFSGGLAAIKLHWFVAAEHRSLIGIRLLKHGEDWARSRGATLIYVSSINDSGGTLLERLGYRQTEIIYQRVL
jgi:GNAT superfamily N-acetyltransferase